MGNFKINLDRRFVKNAHNILIMIKLANQLVFNVLLDSIKIRKGNLHVISAIKLV